MKRWFLFLVGVTGLSLFAALACDAQKKGPLKGDAIHDPANAVANLDVYPELKATLFVSEPKITNPTNLDIDHRGRVWICDVKNYRGHRNSRPEGDRILILEDTKGDGVADKVTTFYQGKDVDSAMGICVLGNKVIVSASPNVLVFTFDENDKILKKEVLFTKTGISQHDHTAHSLVFGPDGRLYWNFGNEGHAVHDKNGKPVVDLAGNVVNDSGKPYRQGMVFRCEMDGTNFEVLGHNFRNNYEVAVDSFGTLWQSDNDDDGNRGCRINYVMEYGNFGYVDELTGAGWQKPRTNIEKEIPLRHWHQNDPGVVPNLLQTGAGSPTGICVYEGNLLPKVFHNQIIHCDAGPSVVRSYPVMPDGAGYKVEQTINILDGSKKNNWFRPADVCVAPDGSIFVTDWYDPGVGGHAQRDTDRGRIFRVAPPNTKYVVPHVDFSTLNGCAMAMKSPNLATRYIAWTKLHEAGAQAESVLLKLWNSSKEEYRARALWLLARIEGKTEAYIEKAIADKNPNMRVIGIRLARQLGLDPIDVGVWLETYKHRTRLVDREYAIMLRTPRKVSGDVEYIWSALALAHTGNDRWYLEALGIGADKNWDRYLDKYLSMYQRTVTFDGKSKGEKDPKFKPIDIEGLQRGYRDIIWRSRAAKTPELLTTLVSSRGTPENELPRLMRAFDFQKDSDLKTESLVKLAFGTYDDPTRAKFITTEAISRLKNFDVNKNPKHAEALDKLLEQNKGTPSFVEMVGKFSASKRFPDLLAIAQKQPGEQIGIDSIRVLLDRDQVQLIQTAFESKDPARAANTAQALAGAQHEKANALLVPIVLDAKQDLELRRQATRAVARTKSGALQLIQLAQEKKLSDDLKFAAGSAISTLPWTDIRMKAFDVFPVAKTKANLPIIPITDLVKQRGNAERGKVVFAKQGTCAKCHTVNGEGKNVGPDLSEIGKKLSREALFESILFPSASILHNYETWVIETKKGTSANGLLVSKTAEEISIKDTEAIVRTFKIAEVESITRSPISLMPADLHQLMSTQELVDMVEYLLTLKEARKTKSNDEARTK